MSAATYKDGERMTQNKSQAVMAQRITAKSELDDFPTHPWAARALVEHGISIKRKKLQQMICLEPACGRGHMSYALAPYFKQLWSCDIYDYGFGVQSDFLNSGLENKSFDWVITNPPFVLCEQFIHRALKVAKVGVAMFARTLILESKGRYNNLYKINPPTTVAQFVERVPLVQGRIDPKASTATGYVWLIWEKRYGGQGEKGTKLVWIPPCRKELEREGDYAQYPRKLRGV